MTRQLTPRLRSRSFNLSLHYHVDRWQFRLSRMMVTRKRVMLRGIECPAQITHEELQPEQQR
jgi:hypothetical protein